MNHAASQTIDVVATHDGGRPAMGRVALGMIGLMVAAVQSERARRRDMATLAQLDDRLLRDIGMCRSDSNGVIRCGY